MLIINLAQRKNREPDCNLVPFLYTLGKESETADWNKLNSLSQAKLMGKCKKKMAPERDN